MICKMIMDGKRDASLVATVLQRIVDGFPIEVTQVWETIRISTGPKTGADFLPLLSKKRRLVDYGARQSLSSGYFSVSGSLYTVDLVRVSVGQLGFRERTGYREICLRAQEFGLQFCEYDVAVQLCLQCENLPDGDFFLVASGPIPGADGSRRILGIFHAKGTSELEGYICDTDDHGSVKFDPNHEFVFVRTKYYFFAP